MVIDANGIGVKCLIDHDCNKAQAEMMEVFIQELPRLRKAAGVSQTTLGKRLGLSRQSISSIERGEVPMTWAVYVAAGAFFHESKKIEDSELLDFIEKNRTFIVNFMKT